MKRVRVRSYYAPTQARLREYLSSTIIIGTGPALHCTTVLWPPVASQIVRVNLQPKKLCSPSNWTAAAGDASVYTSKVHPSYRDFCAPNKPSRWRVPETPFRLDAQQGCVCTFLVDVVVSDCFRHGKCIVAACIWTPGKFHNELLCSLKRAR